jgi:hypothetical protein
VAQLARFAKIPSFERQWRAWPNFVLPYRISVATLVGTFVFAAFALQATHLLAPTTVAMRVTPTFIMRDVETRRERDRKKLESGKSKVAMIACLLHLIFHRMGQVLLVVEHRA